MSIPALGGGASHALQRALMDAAERALADELALLEGDDPAAATAGASGPTARGPVRRRPTGPSESRSNAALLDEAIVVELGGERRSEPLEVAGGWITAPRRGPLETRDSPGALDRSASEPETKPTVAQPPEPEPEPGSEPGSAAEARPTSATAPKPAPAATSAGEPITLERLIVVLKETGIDFRDAHQVLREIRAGAPLPPRAELRALWQAADPAAWEERARARVAAPRTGAEPRETREVTADALPDTDLRRTPVDDVIRDRGWHRAAAHDPSRSASDVRPTLQTVARHTPTNQAYVADLSTAEFQRLVTILGGAAPAWFWELRGHRGLRGLAERPAIARLNATRIAGTRLGAWVLAILGMALLWYLGLRTGTWW